MNTQQLLATARRVMTPNYAPGSFILQRGEGSWAWDAEGKRYLDFSSGIGVNALGHAHPEVVEAITQQAARLCHTSNQFHHAGYIQLCQRLTELSFGEQVFLTNSGTEAMEAALKLSRRYFFRRGEERPRFIATHGSFHGRTLGAVSVTGQPTYHEGFGPLLQSVTFVPYGDVDALREALDPTVAAVILEPIQGNSGVRPAPEGYLPQVAAACASTGTLLIFDEIQTGVARTGRWFSHQHHGVTPQLMTCAKALGGGLPLGALVTTAEVGSAFTLGSHGSTFGGNPVACAAGLATLHIIERDGLVERAQQLGELFLGRLREVAARHPAITEVRGRGLMIGVELKVAAKEARARCTQEGLLVTAAGEKVLRLLPPLNTNQEEIEQAVAMLERAITSAG